MSPGAAVGLTAGRRDTSRHLSRNWLTGRTGKHTGALCGSVPYRPAPRPAALHHRSAGSSTVLPRPQSGVGACRNSTWNRRILRCTHTLLAEKHDHDSYGNAGCCHHIGMYGLLHGDTNDGVEGICGAAEEPREGAVLVQLGAVGHLACGSSSGNPSAAEIHCQRNVSQ